MSDAVVKELPTKLTEEEALRQILAEKEAEAGEELVKAELKEIPIEKIPERPGAREEVQLTEEQKADINARLQAAQQEFGTMVQYIEAKYGVKFMQQVGFQIQLPQG